MLVTRFKLIQNGKNEKVKFALDSFQFEDKEDSQIFIHCNVRIEIVDISFRGRNVENVVILN